MTDTIRVTRHDPRALAALDAMRQLNLPPFPDGSNVTIEDAIEVVEAALGASPTKIQYGIRWDGPDTPADVQWVTTDPNWSRHTDVLRDPDLAKHRPVKVRRTVTTTEWVEDR